MGRKRKQENRGLPTGVYRDGRKFISRQWNGRKLITTGTFTTPEEAHYRNVVAKYGHHWEGIEDGPFIGFIYVITNRETQKKYVGSKQFLHWDGPPGGYKCTDMEDEWWDPKAWKDSDWRTYTGSQKDLNKEIEEGNVWDFTYEVVEMCRTKLDLHIAEVNYMIEHDVLEALDENGEYLWYNKNIASKEFRAPFKKQNLQEARETSLEAMRNYYLRPKVCPHCEAVIPFGSAGCVDCEGLTTISIASLETEGGFDDIR